MIRCILCQQGERKDKVVITKIKNNNTIIVDNFGLPKGAYYVHDLTLLELVRERNLLHAKLFEQFEMEKLEVTHTENLISQLTELIVAKCKGRNI